MTLSTSALVTGYTPKQTTRRGGVTRMNTHHVRTRPIRAQPLGMNKCSRKYRFTVPVESAVGTLIHDTGWANVVSRHNRAFARLSGQVMYTTDHLELIWFCLQAHLLPNESVWYVLEWGIFWVLNIPPASIVHLVAWAGEGDLCTTRVSGTTSLDTFCQKHAHQPAWLVYNALLVLMPTFMHTHHISVSTVSNRCRRYSTKATYR
jgi:hypothetical protein